jgi:excisionase family DNA binding protein
MGPDAAVERYADRRVALAEPLLGADEVATLLAIPRSSVYEYARRRKDPLPAIRIGRHVRFSRSDLERWLAHEAEQRSTP